tara:strand:+ start:53683 stop:54177 length:495 start_codon:yes stop_codon:yes gene_type:complete
MADTARGLVSMTPVVTIAADSDADAVDAIHHDIKATLGGKLEYEKADANDKWVYSASRDITGTSADVIASGTSFTEGGTTVVGDHLKYLFLKNSGTTDGSTSTSAKVYICLDAGDAASVGDVIEVGASEAINLKFKDGLDCGDVHVATSTGTVRCTIAAILDDV